MESRPTYQHILETLDLVAQRHRRQERQLERTRKELHGLILEAKALGNKQATIARISGYTEAHISNLVKKSREGS